MFSYWQFNLICLKIVSLHITLRIVHSKTIQSCFVFGHIILLQLIPSGYWPN